MNFKISVILLHLFTQTLPIKQNSTHSLTVLATNIDTNDAQSIIRQFSNLPTTIVSQTCNGQFCYKMSNETTTNATKTQIISFKKYDQLKSSSVLYGILKTASKRETGNTCYHELNQIYNGVHSREIWAIKALDSSAMPEPGFVLGQNFWLGSIKGCASVQKPPPLTISNRFQRFMHSDLLTATAPFKIDYRMVYAEHRSPLQIQVEFVLEKIKILHIGLCVPVSCSNDQISNLTQEYFDEEFLDTQIINDYQPNVLEVKDLHPSVNYMEKTSFRLLVLCFGFTILMMIISYLREDTACDQNQNVLVQTPQQQLNGTTMAYSESASNPPDIILQCRKIAMPKRTLLDNLIDCYSIRDNYKMLISCNKSPNAVPIIDGLKSIGAFLILLFHMGWYMHYTVHNSAMLFSYGEEPLWQWVSATPIIVDVFFAISGLLLSYNFLRNQTKLEEIRTNSLWQNVKAFGRQLLNRYIRLTPLYLVIVGIMEVVTSELVDTSVFWVTDRYDITCNKYWWRNMFYIQNLFHVDDLCVTWSWSLACEMQFFILFTVLLFVYAKYPNAAKAIFCSLFGLFSTLIFAIAMFTKFTPAYDVMHSLGTDLYVSPWTRILPYLIGVAAGYFMFTYNGVMPLGEKTIKMVWALTSTMVVLAHISTMDRSISHVIAAPLISSIRILYSASVCWMIVASQMGHGGFFARVLNSSICVHVNKLTYAIYLLNPAIITVVYGFKDHSTHVDPMTMIVMSTGVMVIVYLASIVFTLMFEIPYTNLSSKLLKSSPNRTKLPTPPATRATTTNGIEKIKTF